MNTISRRCRYGLRALYLLTTEYQRGPISSARIAREENISRKFLEAILLQMRNKGIVESQQGKKGGYYLSSPPDQITFGAIVRAIDGPLETLPCIRKENPKRCPDCADLKNCETRTAMLEVKNALANVLDGMTLSELCKQRVADSIILNYDI